MNPSRSNKITSSIKISSKKEDSSSLYDIKAKSGIISIREYRKILNDDKSSDEQIIKRLDYLESLCRNVIRSEIASYVKR